MKKITKQFLFCALSLSALTFVSCDNDDATGASTLEVNDVVGTIGLVAPLATTQTVNEGDEGTFQYTITLDKPQSVDIHVKVKQIAGSANSDDFTFDEEVVIPAYATTGTGSVTILNDVTVEGVEDFTLKIGAVTTANANVASSEITFNINNFIGDDLDLVFHFDKTFSGSAGYTNNLCNLTSSLSSAPYDKYDIDFIVYDEFYTDLSVFDAQTGACTEALTMSLADYTDGLYHISAFLFANADLDLAMLQFPLVGAAEFDIPVTVDYMRVGAITQGTYTQESINYFTSNTAVNAENGLVDVLISTDPVTGYRSFTIQDTAGNVSASGKSAKKFNHISTRKK